MPREGWGVRALPLAFPECAVFGLAQAALPCVAMQNTLSLTSETDSIDVSVVQLLT